MSTGERPKKVRLFVAFEVPEAHLDALAAALDPVRENLRGARWTTREQQHVTLKFIGWMDPDRLGEVERTCAGVAAGVGRGDVTLTEVGAFPKLRRARVLWVGIEDPGAITPRLAADLDEALVPLGVEAEERAYTPHLTLARFKPPQDVRSTADIAVPDLDPFPIEAITLFRSHLGRSGPRYEVVQRFPLR